MNKLIVCLLPRPHVFLGFRGSPPIANMSRNG